MITRNLSQIFKQYACSVFRYLSFYWKPDTIIIIISSITDLSL